MIFQKKEADLSEDVGEHQWLEQFGDLWKLELESLFSAVYVASTTFFPL